MKEIPPVAEKLMEHFWPGPLTIILPRKEGISEKVTAGLNTVGVRMPDHPVALALIEEQMYLLQHLVQIVQVVQVRR